MMTARKTNNEQMAELSDLLLIMMVEWNRKIAVGLLADNFFLTIEDKLGMICTFSSTFFFKLTKFSPSASPTISPTSIFSENHHFVLDITFLLKHFPTDIITPSFIAHLQPP